MSAIMPALLDELSGQMTVEMTQKQKLEILSAKLPEFKEMISSFMSGKEEEELLIFLVAKSCAKAIDILGACFYLIL